MKKVAILTIVCVMCCVALAGAQPKKIALIARISWAPDSEGAAAGNRDFDIMPHFSMDDELLRHLVDSWGYFSILMPDYVTQYVLDGGDMANLGYASYINPGVYMEQPNFFQDNKVDLIYVTGTCWSSTAPRLKDINIPVIQGEHSCFGQRDKIGSLHMFFGQNSGDHNTGTDTIVLTEAGKAHELTAGLPEQIKVFGDGPTGPPENPGQAWYGIHNAAADAAPGTKVLATWLDNPEQAALAVVETGGELADGTKAQARRVTMFWTGQVRPVNGAELPPVWVNVIEHLTPMGVELNRRCVRWALGETTTPVANWQAR